MSNGLLKHPPLVVSRNISPATYGASLPFAAALPIVPTKTVSVPGRLQQLPTPPPSPSWVVVPAVSHSVSNQTSSLHRRDEKSQSQLPTLQSNRSGTPVTAVAIGSDGSRKDVRLPTLTDSKSGKSNSGDESQLRDKSDGKYDDGNVKLKQLLNSLSGTALKVDPESFRQAAHVLKSFSPWASAMNTSSKWYLFSSSDRAIEPWSFDPAYALWAPLGLNNTTGGAGWADTGITYLQGVKYSSNDISLAVDFIPLANPASANGIDRLGNCIRIHQIGGHFWVKRWPLEYNVALGVVSNYRPAIPSRVMTYIQRTPINLGAATDPTSQSYNHGQVDVAGVSIYPTPALQAVGPDQTATGFDFLTYASASFFAAPLQPTPYLTNAAPPVWQYNGASCVTNNMAQTLHRSPTVGTEVYDVKVHEREVNKGRANYLGTAPTFSSAAPLGNKTTDIDWDMQPAESFDFPVKHHFKHGIKVVYDDTGTTNPNSIASINQLRVKFWAEDTGALYQATNPNTVQAIAQNGFHEEIRYEFWVEYTDCRVDDL